MSESILNINPLGFPWKTQDPFLFCVYHADDYPRGNEELGPASSLEGRNIGQDFVLKDGWRMYHGDKVPGFPAHPHRGFETVTIVKKGIVDHADSLGATARFGNGDTQWLTSGKGLQHSEMFPLLNQEAPNPLVLFQLWLNLPKANKFVDPHFKMLWAESIPLLQLKDASDRAIKVELTAGRIGEVQAPDPSPNSWAADPANEVLIATIEMEANAEWTLPLASVGIGRSVYFYEGSSVQMGGYDIQPNHSVDLDAAQSVTIKNGNSTAYFLILQGRPIKEPVVQHGPFVMNSQEEIQAAFKEYRQTQFGGWPWGSAAPTHDRSQGRFAKHINGEVEEKV